jgi:hypothetical protein
MRFDTQIGLRLCIAATDTVWICVTGTAFASYDDAANFALSKARQIIDLQGERIFG